MLVGAAGLGHCICLVVALVMYVLAEIFVIGLVAIFAFYGRTNFLGKFHLGLALNLDGVMGGAERCEKICF